MMNEDRNEQSCAQDGEVERLSSLDLAALVIDALLRAGIMKPDDVERAIAIAKEEIEVRKILGDY